MNKKQKKILIRIIIATLLFAIRLFLIKSGYFSFALFIVTYFVIGYDILIKAFKGIFRGQAFDENFLMAIATVGAIILGEFVEATAVILFYQIGEFFQSIAVSKSRKNIKELMNLSPEYANLLVDDCINVVFPSEVEVGSTIIVKQGERIPLDGIVIEGEALVDSSALTGESLPHSYFVGDEIVSGCVNLGNVIKIKTTKKYEDSTVAKILELIENSTSRKASSEKFISKFAKYYTPVVCFAALALATIPPTVSMILNGNQTFGLWLYRALTFLVISCPCALVISIPLTFFSTIGSAGKKGILIKGSNFIETLSKTRCVVFDKTGTLTKGTFKVSKVNAIGISEQKLIEYASHCEIYSNHPISKCIRDAFQNNIDSQRVTNVDQINGRGVVSNVDGISVAVGNEKLMETLKIEYDKTVSGSTVAHVAIEGIYRGYICVSDQVKDSSLIAIQKLKEMGIKRLVMLSGDAGGVVERVSEELGLNEAYGSLMPTDKVSKVEELISEFRDGEKLVFVGDGVNDAPVIARADVGVAMGALGSDSAIEAADVVLMDDNPEKLPTAIHLSKKCMRIVYENIYISLLLKFICLVLGAVGVANMWMAIFADVGVMVIAVINAMRAFKV